MIGERIALFAFNGEVMCFVHVLLNAMDMKAKGADVAVVLEGASVKVIPEMTRSDHPMVGLYRKAKEAGVVDGACRGCAVQLGVAEDLENEGIPLLADMKGHVSMGTYIQKGYRIITF